jgi:glycerophosphoryl diester phosphodiesterase
LRALNAPAWLTERPIAHRGLHDAAEGVIENTLAAAEAAIAGGFAIECDVQLSADEEVFVFHDERLDRLTDSEGALIEQSAAQIRSVRIVTPGAASAPAPQRAFEKTPVFRRAIITRDSALQRPTSTAEPRTKESLPPKLGATPHPNPPPQGRRGRARSQADIATPVIPTFAEFLALVAGRTPVICELKSRFNADWRIAARIAALAAAYEGPLAFKSFDPDLVAYLRLRWPRLGPPGRPCPVGMVAEASYDDPYWSFLSDDQRRECAEFAHVHRSEPDFLSWNVDDLPHKVPFFMKELNGLPVMAWTVRNAAQREAARKWADQIVFEGEGAP